MSILLLLLLLASSFLSSFSSLATRSYIFWFSRNIHFRWICVLTVWETGWSRSPFWLIILWERILCLRCFRWFVFRSQRWCPTGFWRLQRTELGWSTWSSCWSVQEVICSRRDKKLIFAIYNDKSITKHIKNLNKIPSFDLIYKILSFGTLMSLHVSALVHFLLEVVFILHFFQFFQSKLKTLSFSFGTSLVSMNPFAF